MSFSIDDLDEFKNGYNLRFFNVKDCPKCKSKDSFAHCLMPYADRAYNCDVCEYREEFEEMNLDITQQTLNSYNLQIANAEVIKNSLAKEKDIKHCFGCGQYKFLDDFRKTEKKYVKAIKTQKGRCFKCLACEK